MLRVFFGMLMCIVFILPQRTAAQATEWPPEALIPAPIMANLSLAGGRIVPSTSRYNLVWADQLRPYTLTSGKIEFAAKHFIGSQKLWADQADQFRAHDANFLMLIYHLAAGLNPPHNDDCPDPKSLSGDDYIGVVAPEGYVSEWEEHFLPWLQVEGIPIGSPRFENMFQHFDSVHATSRVWHLDPYWLMNLDNTDWRRYLSATCEAWMHGNENEGCFFDVAVETNAFFYNPRQQNAPPGDFDWWAAPHHPAQQAGLFSDRRAFADWMNAQYLAYFQSIYRDFHFGNPSRLVIPNVDQMVTSVYDLTWLDGDAAGECVDGVMIEGFGNYRGYDMWLTLERCVRHVTGRGKILIAQFSNHSREELYRRTAMYMLVKNENSYINAVAEDVRWYPEYEIDLGDQMPLASNLEQLRVAGSAHESVWRRDFAQGMVLVNTSDSSMTYTLPAERSWEIVRTFDGGVVADDGTPVPQSITYQKVAGDVSIPGSGGLILRAQPTTEVERVPQPALALEVYPQPAVHTLHVRLRDVSSEAHQIDLVDVLGRVYRTTTVGPRSYGTQTGQWFTIDVSDAPPGCYHVIVRSGSRVVAARPVVLGAY